MPAPSISMACPVCGRTEARPLIQIPEVPVLCNFLYASKEEALLASSGAVDLVCCRHCGHLYNAAFDRDLINYRPGYANPLHYSGRCRMYAEEQAQRLLTRYELAGRKIVDIGCGDGAFLKLFRQKGQCQCIGFEPSMAPDAAITSSGGKIRVFADTFSSRFADIGAELYVARHVLEHLADPLPFLETIRSAMDSGNPVLFLEVPDSSSLLAHGSTWDIIYEHVSYFTAHSLAYLLHLSGFSCDTPRSVFSGQYLAVDAFPAGSSSEQRWDNLAATSRLTESFLACYHARQERTEKLLNSVLADDHRAVVWGAGSKGIAFLNSLPAGINIPYIIDINPGKQGKFVPGSGQQVMPPEFLADYRPDTVFIANDIYREEIRACLDALKVSARMVRI